MGWSDIVSGTHYEEPDLRAAVVEFVTGLDLHDVTLAGESLGGALALSLPSTFRSRVKRVVAFNSYDYPSGLKRGNLFALDHYSSVRMPGLGPVFAAMENRSIMKGVMRGGVVDNAALPDDFIVGYAKERTPQGICAGSQGGLSQPQGIRQGAGPVSGCIGPGHAGLQRARLGTSC